VLDPGSWSAPSLKGVFTLVSMCIGWFLQVGMLRMLLAAARGQSAPLSLLFSGADRFDDVRCHAHSLLQIDAS